MAFRPLLPAASGPLLAGLASLALVPAPAQASSCFLTALATCDQSVDGFTFSGFSISGFTANAGDEFVLTSPANTLGQVQLNFSPGRTVDGFSGSFSYTVALAAGRTFTQAQANITGSVTTFATSTASGGLTGPATATSGTGSLVAFNPGLNTATFTQTFSKGTGGVLNSLGTAFVTTAPGTDVPGPLPILGAAAAFKMSRRMRTRIRASA